MFHLLIQEPIDGHWQSERFVCFEADSRDEAIERAEWFGIDLNERVGLEEGYEGYFRWWWHESSSSTSRPEINGIPIETAHHNFRQDWIIVYKNGNLKSNGGMSVEAEISLDTNRDA